MNIKTERPRRWLGAGVLLAVAVMAGTVSLLAFAYVQQSDRVDSLENENEKILGDHRVIGKAFAKQTKKLAQQSRKLEQALQASYGQGFRAGQEASRLPRALRPLARHAATGFSVPRSVPDELASTAPRIKADVDGYAIRWRGLALFASRTDPLSVWTRQALDGRIRTSTLGGHPVRRLVGPSGVVYAWRERGSTYALIALPRLEPVARELVGSTK